MIGINYTENSIPDSDRYDLIIRTQAEFDRMVADPDWFGATHVGLASEGNDYIYSGTDKLVVPTNVRKIVGLRSKQARIKSTFGVWANGHVASAKNLSISATARTPFDNFSSVENCHGNLTYESVDPANIYPVFNSCNRLTNCLATATRSTAAFSNCNNLINCTVTRMNSSSTEEVGVTDILGFVNCGNLFGCIMTVTTFLGINVSCYRECSNIINCSLFVYDKAFSPATPSTATYLLDKCSNVINFQVSSLKFDGVPTILRDCDHISNCKLPAEIPAGTKIFAGANTHVDSETIG